MNVYLIQRRQWKLTCTAFNDVTVRQKPQQNVPGQGAALRLKQERQNQPLWQENYRGPEAHVGVGGNHATILGDTFVGEDGPDTEPFHDDLEVGKESTEGDRSGLKPQLKDL